MEQRAADAAYAKLHEKEPYHNGSFTSWSKDRGPDHPYHFNDGVSIGVSGYDIAPHDKFTTERDASPEPPEGGDDQVPES